MRDPDGLRCKKNTGGYITILSNAIVSGYQARLSWTYADGAELIPAENELLSALMHIDGMATSGGWEK